MYVNQYSDRRAISESAHMIDANMMIREETCKDHWEKCTTVSLWLHDHDHLSSEIWRSNRGMSLNFIRNFTMNSTTEVAFWTWFCGWVGSGEGRWATKACPGCGSDELQQWRGSAGGMAAGERCGEMREKMPEWVGLIDDLVDVLIDHLIEDLSGDLRFDHIDDDYWYAYYFSGGPGGLPARAEHDLAGKELQPGLSETGILCRCPIGLRRPHEPDPQQGTRQLPGDSLHWRRIECLRSRRLHEVVRTPPGEWSWMAYGYVDGYATCISNSKWDGKHWPVHYMLEVTGCHAWSQSPIELGPRNCLQVRRTHSGHCRGSQHGESRTPWTPGAWWRSARSATARPGWVPWWIRPRTVSKWWPGLSTQHCLPLLAASLRSQCFKSEAADSSHQHTDRAHFPRSVHGDISQNGPAILHRLDDVGSSFE